MKNINRAIFILSLVGLVISVFLAYEYSQTDPIACPITGSGCEIVRKSAYSSLLGISLPYLGLVFYLMLAALSVFLTQSFNRLISLFRLFVSFSGFIFGLYLTYLEAFVIGAYCIWCLASFIVSIIIFVLCLTKIQNENRNKNISSSFNF